MAIVSNFKSKTASKEFPNLAVCAARAATVAAALYAASHDGLLAARDAHGM